MSGVDCFDGATIRGGGTSNGPTAKKEIDETEDLLTIHPVVDGRLKDEGRSWVGVSMRIITKCKNIVRWQYACSDSIKLSLYHRSRNLGNIDGRRRVSWDTAGMMCQKANSRTDASTSQYHCTTWIRKTFNGGWY
jgi:hypothetical protein